MVVIVPADAEETKQALKLALRRNGPDLHPGLPQRNAGDLRGRRAVPDREGSASSVTVKISPSPPAAYPSSWPWRQPSSSAKSGISVDLLAVATVKPMDVEALAASASKTKTCWRSRSTTSCGGFGGAVAEALAKHAPAKMDFIGVQDRFTESGPYDALMKKYGISVEAIVAKAKALVAAKPVTAVTAASAPGAKKAVAKPTAQRPVTKAKAVKRPAAKKAVKKMGAKKPTPKKPVAKRSARGKK